MKIYYMVYFCLHVFVQCKNDLTLISKTHSSRLEKYVGYSDALILNFNVPIDSHFAAFKFKAEEVALSLFHCKPQDVTVYLKEGSPPVINPDLSKFPDDFVNITRPQMFIANFTSNKSFHYINITSPSFGNYFAAAFVSYTDPKQQGITQKGLTPDCWTFIDVSLYVDKKSAPTVVAANQDQHVLLSANVERFYKFYVPEIVDSAILIIRDFKFSNTSTYLNIKMSPNVVPNVNNSIYDINLKREDYFHLFRVYYLRFATLENSWFYFNFKFKNDNKNETGEFVYRIKYYSSFANVFYDKDNQSSSIEVKTEAVTDSTLAEISKLRNNVSTMFKQTVLRNYQSTYLITKTAYKQYNLVRDGHMESFVYSFDLKPLSDGYVPVSINMSNDNVYVLQFYINSGLDTGGTLQISSLIKPIDKKTDKTKDFENQTVIACIRNQAKEIPTWPNKCVYSSKINESPMMLNNTSNHSTIMIPYPEPGNWYVSFKLFCGECKPCACTESCTNLYRDCSTECKMYCEETNSCDLCIDQCERSVIKQKACAGCDCDGPCLRNKERCDTRLIFVIASYPCMGGGCGPNGKCMYMVSEGLAYSLCHCVNNYKGWSCSDDSEASSYGMIILELLLLVLSNMGFLPAAYVAYKRDYYVEAIVYFSACFFSTFYHACDAGENIYSYCLVQLHDLQFADFFCGLLSIWVTVIAMAYLPNPWPPIFHIGGAILLAFGTTINKTALWVFALPFLTGIFILIISWYLQYKKTGVHFPSKRYLHFILPTGIAAVTAGLLMFALLQTKDNYKYVHSTWHVLMAVSIIVLLPNKKSFLPAAVESIN